MQMHQSMKLNNATCLIYDSRSCMYCTMHINDQVDCLLRVEEGSDYRYHKRKYIYLLKNTTIRTSSLPKNCSLFETDRVREQKSAPIFAPSWCFCLKR